MIKHFFWDSHENSGRIALRATDQRFVVKRLAGNAPPAGIVWKLLHETEREFLEQANEQHRCRKHRYAVEKRVGMSGCINFLLREERDVELDDFPITARLHVSMYGKLNEDVSMWPGDLIPILTCRAHVAIPEDGEITLEEATVGTYEFKEPSAFLTETAEGYDISVSSGGVAAEETLERLQKLFECL